MLAIVIPYYKVLFFKDTLQSLANQTDKRFKVYIGNDASPEDPKFILDQFREHLSFNYTEFEANLGSQSLVNQWERCMEMIQNEEWIMILGDDDTLASNVVASFYENLPEIVDINSTVIRYASQVIDENGNAISSIYRHPKLELGPDFLIRKFKGGTRSSLSEYIFKKEKIDGIRFKDFPLAWFSDLLAVFECGFQNPILSINDSIVNFRWSGINITSKNDDLVLKNKSSFYFYKYLLNNYKDNLPIELLQLLFNGLEKTILENKKEILYWIILFRLYLKCSQVKRTYSLGIKIIKSIK